MSLADLADTGETDTALKVEGTRQAVSFSGLVTANPLNPGDRGAFHKIFDLAGLSEDDYRLEADSLKFSTWQQSARTADGSRDLIQLFNYGGRFVKVTPGDIDADEAASLLLLTRGHNHPQTGMNVTTGARVVIISDPQVGKVDHRGGTPELLTRVPHPFTR